MEIQITRGDLIPLTYGVFSVLQPRKTKKTKKEIIACSIRVLKFKMTENLDTKITAM